MYLAVQPFQQDEELSRKLRELSKSANIPLVATGDVHYIHQEDKTAYTCLKAIKAGQQLSEIEEDQADKHFRSIEEMMNGMRMIQSCWQERWRLQTAVRSI